MSKTKNEKPTPKGTATPLSPVGTKLSRTFKAGYSHIIMMLYSIAENGRKSGRASGNVYMRNGRIRGFVVPALVRNSYTSAARLALAGFSSLYRALSPEQQAGWLNFSFSKSDRFGVPFAVKGKQAYVALNTNLTNIGGTLIDDAPSAVGSVGVSLLDLTPDLGTPELTLRYVPVALGQALVFATASLSAGVFRPSQSAYRLIGTFDPTEASPVNLLSEYNAKFGAMIEGSKIFVQVVNINTVTGESSPITEVSAIVLNT